MNAIPLSLLPEDHGSATLVGRVFHGGRPKVVAVRETALIDLTGLADTMSALLEISDIVGKVAALNGPRIPWTETVLLAPCDIQAIKAAGVTFADSMLERVIEERSHGDASRAGEIRARIEAVTGNALSNVRPGTPEAETVRETMTAAGMWSQYLEVGLGPYPEVFTKAQPLSAVGSGAEVGLHPDSRWNNPEPEVVLAVNSEGHIVGAALGNDVNLRDMEGRSALLLPLAKDNNASCAIGPFIRLFDAHFTLDDVRAAEVTVEIDGEDGFRCTGSSTMRRISRDPEELVAHCLRAHQYPDGFVLFCGTMFVPTADRDAPGHGFTHHMGDCVRIRSARLGCLENRVTRSDLAAPWTFGIGALLKTLRAGDQR